MPQIPQPEKLPVVAFTLTAFEIGIVITAVLYNLFIFIFALLWIFTNSFTAFKSTLHTISVLAINEQVSYALFLSGALGGSFYCLRSVYIRLSEAARPENDSKREFNIKIWFFWYIFRPLQSGALALITLCLVNANLLTLNVVKPESLKSFYTLVGVGFLVGLGTHEVIRKVEELIAVLFAKAKTK